MPLGTGRGDAFSYGFSTASNSRNAHLHHAQIHQHLAPHHRLVDREVVSPYKLALAIVLKGFLKSFVTEEEVFSPRQRIRFFLKLIKLCQGPDLSPRALRKALSGEINEHFQGRMDTIMVQLNEGVEGFMDKIAGLISFMQYDGHLLIHRTSYIGHFVRRTVLYFDKLSFSDVSELYDQFHRYLTDMNNAEMDDEPEVQEDFIKNRKQTELYIAEQVALLENCETQADSPAKIKKNTDKILHRDATFSEARFLAYLNSLRIKDYTSAVHHLTLTSNPVENNDKAFRFAAQNLGALHDQFGHKECALTALYESVMRSQESKDGQSLQKALALLAMTLKDDDMLGNLVENCAQLKMHNLMGLALLSLAQSKALKGAKPEEVFTNIKKSEMLACHYHLTDLTQNCFALKSSLWLHYGKTEMSGINAQLALLHLNAYEKRLQNLPDGLLINEHVALAFTSLAKTLFTRGLSKESWALLRFGRNKLIRSPSLNLETLFKQTELEMSFYKAVYDTDWIMADRCLTQLTNESGLLRLQLCLAKGDAKSAEKQIESLENSSSVKENPVSKVRFLVYKAELFCLSSAFANAVEPLLTALGLCRRMNFSGLEALVKLHLSHVQLQMDLAADALRSAQSALPAIIAQHDRFEQGRARFLVAKCLVASSMTKPERRLDCLKAVEELRQSLADFKAAEAHYRVKDVLYMMARLYHSLDMIQERNQASAEFKKTEEQFQTNVTCRLANML